MTPIPFHPYADIFPLMQGAEFDGLVEDIRLNGVRDPIMLLDGKILDGRNRYRALVRLFESAAPRGPGWGVWNGQPLTEEDFDLSAVQHPFRRYLASESGDALDFVESKNLHRRDLTPSQRAACAAEIEVLRHGGRRATAPDPQQDANLQLASEVVSEPQRPAETRADLAERYNVSERSIADAAKVREQGAPELREALKQGDVVADVAAAVAENLPQAAQVTLLANLPRDEDGKLTPEARREVRKVADELKAEKLAEKRARRETKEQELGQRQLAMPGVSVGCYVEDYEWDDEVWSRETGMDRHAANHYPVSEDAHTATEIHERTKDRFANADKDCVLFQWSTVQHLAIAVDLMRLRGFTYKSHYVWGKPTIGKGFWNRNKHEILLIGVKGHVPCPAPGLQWISLIEAPKGAHSAKPDVFIKMIEDYFPTFVKMELNARDPNRDLAPDDPARVPWPRPGWLVWGHEASAALPPATEAVDAADDDFDIDDATGQPPPLPWAAWIDADAEAEAAAENAAEVAAE